jgi:hypothetical protein
MIIIILSYSPIWLYDNTNQIISNNYIAQLHNAKSYDLNYKFIMIIHNLWIVITSYELSL